MLIHHREVSLHFAAVLLRGIVNFEERWFTYVYMYGAAGMIENIVVMLCMGG